jgi:cytochrome c peroxidase
MLRPARALEALPRTPPIPADNPQSPAKVELGKELFFDPRISKTGRTSCFSCHDVMAGGEDNLAFGMTPEGRPTRHSVPTVWNAAYLSSQFWTGGAPTLEAQAEGPLEEMGLGDAQAVVANVRKIPGYLRQFQAVFGDGGVTLTRLTQALAAYERTLVTPGSRFDRFARGEAGALSPIALRGLRLFQSVGCVSCHSGPAFAGPTVGPGPASFAKFPVFADSELVRKYRLAEDPGRFTATQDERDRNVWRVPTLLNIAATAPYFHNGSVTSLEEAVRVMAKVQLDRELSDAAVRELTEFLKSLTGPFPRQAFPRLPLFSRIPEAP